MFLIDYSIPLASLQSFLESLGWIKEENILSVEIPGEGNMNVVVRVKTDQRTFILKQSRPYVRKYDQIPAPLDRIAVENAFYQSLPKHPAFPKILAFDISHHLMMMEDLGIVQDLTSMYTDRSITDTQLEGLVNILPIIHTSAPKEYPDNTELRKLNHQHLFVLPFLEENGFNLNDVQNGLSAVAKPYQTDLSLRKKIEHLGDQYLSKGNTLIHGDYYPGSWMQVDKRLYVIDPEFSFVGFVEFDLGVMAAHLIMATGDGAYIDRVIQLYPNSINEALVSQVAGIEILRRLIGLAQLPLERSLEEKAALLKLASGFIHS